MKLLWLIAATACAQTASLDHGITFSAEYLVRSIPTQGGTLTTNDYLVVEASFSGPKNDVKVAISQFKLRINGKTTLETQIPGMVIVSMTHPEYSSRPVVDATAGPLVISSRPSTERFPGDPTPRVPQAPRVQKQEESIDDRIQHAAMPEGDLIPPIRGFVFPIPRKNKNDQVA